MNYKEHRKELLKNKAVKAEYEKLQPEYELARSIMEQRLRKKMTQLDALCVNITETPPLW